MLSVHAAMRLDVRLMLEIMGRRLAKLRDAEDIHRSRTDAAPTLKARRSCRVTSSVWMSSSGRDVLSPLAVFVTNVPGVWGVLALSLYGAAVFDRGWAFVAVDLVLVNTFVHVVHAIIFRRDNPGLATALLFFLPLGGVTYWLLLQSGAGTVFYQATGLIVAVAIHAAILLHVRRRAAVRGR
jgi:hypothetical protein